MEYLAQSLCTIITHAKDSTSHLPVVVHTNGQGRLETLGQEPSVRADGVPAMSRFLQTAKAHATEETRPSTDVPTPAQATQATQARDWSTQQTTIFDWFEAGPGSGNLIVAAYAGTGKTTTILEGVNRAPEARVLLAAFNKRIADELKGRLTNPHAEARTLHAVGFSIIRAISPQSKIPQGRNTRDIDLAKAGARAVQRTHGRRTEEPPWNVLTGIARLHTTAREVLSCARGPQDLVALAEQFHCEPDQYWVLQGWDLEFYCEAAYAAMELAAEHYETIDFADMIYLPLRNNWAAPQYDLVVVDEAQDMTLSQLELARKVLEPDGRMCVVGDRHQAIYGFRGADSGSLDRLKTELQASELPLSVTYRCGTGIVEAARAFVPDFEAGPDTGTGIVRTESQQSFLLQVERGDFILSRVNAPLAYYCLALIRNGIPAEIAGKDISEQLKGTVAKVSAKNPDLSVLDFSARLESWRVKEKARLVALKFETRAEALDDQVETISILCEGSTTVAGLIQKLDRLFTDEGMNANRVLCSSVHKAKGLESNRVWILDWTLVRQQRHPRQDMREERNIEYVGITRARKELVYVHKGEER